MHIVLQKKEMNLSNLNISRQSSIEIKRMLCSCSQLEEDKKCILCNNTVPSFCNSHSLPKFCLKKIQKQGMVLIPFAHSKNDLLPFDKGINQAGTFHQICHSCDHTRFTEYENPLNYTQIPTSQMLLQIALKNTLKNIDKKKRALSLYQNLPYCVKIDDFLHSNVTEFSKTYSRDIEDAYKDLKYIKKALSSPINRKYILNFYLKLDYEIPIAVQTNINIVKDINGSIINNVHNFSPKYELQTINICAFPLENYSVIFLFSKEGHNRLRTFFKSLNQLDTEDALRLISYLLFLYSEDFYLTPHILEKLKQPIVEEVGLRSNIYYLECLRFDNNPKNTQKYISPKEKIGITESGYDLSEYKRFPNIFASYK